jgi:Cft2 family RNA processing exonuclease
MVKFTSHFSNSSGNLYTLQLGDTKILLECGINFKTILKTINLSEYIACFVTHEHKDHSCCIDKILDYIDVYASAETINQFSGTRNIDLIKIAKMGKCIDIISNEKLVEMGELSPYYESECITILPFNVFHNTKEPLGFLIKYKDYKILFAIDTYKIPYTFKGLTHIFIEANYSKAFLDDGFNRGMYHMEIADTLKFIEENMSDKLQEVKLLHISKEFGDEEIFNDRLNELLKKCKNNYEKPQILAESKILMKKCEFNVNTLKGDKNNG